MKRLINCRRSSLALIGMVCCVIITLSTGVDTSGAIALIVTSVAGANAAQAVFTKPVEQGD